MRRFIVMIVLFFVVSPATSVKNEDPFDEYAESPTVYIRGCGVFPAVRLVVDGRETEGRAFIRRSRAYLPAREVLEQLGGKVHWMQGERAFYASFPERDRTVRVAVGSPAVTIYQYSPSSRSGAGSRVGSVRLNASPFQCEGRVFAPVRVAVEAAGGSVQYERNTRTVYITSPKASST
ncbi:MAG: copper amine oxidase N-terminal domain-containing protein [Armatimonadetes bacterium]|nr:copper amine oxidase N-terminal domain-containing protein [Armatimonadota bacterium]